MSLNTKNGLFAESGSAVTATSCTISKNGEWGVYGYYYASPKIYKSIITGNKGGGIYCQLYECIVVINGSVLTGNTDIEVKNGGDTEWDLRGNFWGASLTKSLKANNGVVSSPSIVGKVRMDEFLEETPKECGASITSLNGQKLW